MILIFCWLGTGFFISLFSTILSVNKKIKPRPIDTLLTVFLWPYFFIDVLIWQAKLTKEQKEEVRKLLNEKE